MKFHANWQGKFSERIHGVIKLYVSSERNKWLKEAQAMLLLRKTEHPNIVKYLWVSRGKSIQFPTEKLSQEYRNLLTDANNRFVTLLKCIKGTWTITMQLLQDNRSIIAPIMAGRTKYT